jgi:hypothetical protein
MGIYTNMRAIGLFALMLTNMAKNVVRNGNLTKKTRSEDVGLRIWRTGLVGVSFYKFRIIKGSASLFLILIPLRFLFK